MKTPAGFPPLAHERNQPCPGWRNIQQPGGRSGKKFARMSTVMARLDSSIQMDGPGSVFRVGSDHNACSRMGRRQSRFGNQSQLFAVLFKQVGQRAGMSFWLPTPRSIGRQRLPAR